MIKFRDSIFSKMVVWLMLISITLVSCDPNGHLSSDISMSNQAQEVADFYASQGVVLDSGTIKSYMVKARSRVLADKAQGKMTSRTDLIHYLANEAKKSGDLKPNELSEANLDELGQKLEKLRYITAENTIEPAVNYLVDEGDFTSADKAFIMDLEETIKSEGATTPEQTIEILNRKIDELGKNTSLSDEHKDAFITSMNVTKAILVEEGVNNFDATLMSQVNDNVDNTSVSDVVERCEIIECLTTYEWVLAVIYVVVTIAVIILAIFTFGISLLFTTIIAVAAWTLVTSVFCWLIPCPGEDPCPEGQEPFCEGNFTFDPDFGFCINLNLPSNAFHFQGCIMSPRPSNGACPSGSIDIPGNQNCIWECFSPLPEGFGEGENGFQFNHECK